MKRCTRTPLKIRFEDERQAWFKAYEVFEKYGSETTPYKCKPCGGWHLTSGAGTVPNYIVEIMEKVK